MAVGGPGAALATSMAPGGSPRASLSQTSFNASAARQPSSIAVAGNQPFLVEANPNRYTNMLMPMTNRTISTLRTGKAPDWRRTVAAGARECIRNAFSRKLGPDAADDALRRARAEMAAMSCGPTVGRMAKSLSL